MKMKKILFCALLFCALSAFSTNLLANAYINFAGVPGFQTLSFPITLTTCSSPVNCTPNPVLTPMTVTFSMLGGSGACQPGVCSGIATSVLETFSTPAVAYALFSAPASQATTITYWLHGTQVGPTQFQTGGMYNLQRSAHTMFDTVQFSWSTATNFKFYQGTFDAVPEPSTLLLLGSGLVGIVGVARRKLF
jgi:PEP-CTERM motif-containing protein